MDYNSSDDSSDSESDRRILTPATDQVHHFDDEKRHVPFPAHQPKPPSLASTSLLSFALGASFATSLIALVLVRLWYPSSPHWRHAFYGLTLSTFHFLEFWVVITASSYNPTAGSRAASAKSLFFPTENLPAYLMAHAFAFLECLVCRLLYFHWNWWPFRGPLPSVVLGLVFCIGAQLVRTLAAVQLHHRAGGSLGALIDKHHGKHNKDRHGGGGGRGGEQVPGGAARRTTTGIYGVMRHPAYFGFFWWAVGTQMVLGNFFSLLAAVLVGWSTFAGRVKSDDESLGRSLGKPYLDYKRRVGTMMPFAG